MSTQHLSEGSAPEATAPEQAAARRALALLDLTNLNDDCAPSEIDALCAAAVTPHGAVAAVCVWPQFVPQAVACLRGTGVKVATVANFPDGAADPERTARETAAAVADGADEVDVVIPWRALLGGDERAVASVVAACRAAAPSPLQVKTILETGDLQTAETIGAAAQLAIAAGANFLKTSTGKRPVGATPEAATTLLAATAAVGRPVGVKISGGVRTRADAAAYLALADAARGADWARPDTFRFGASSLLGDLLKALA